MLTVNRLSLDKHFKNLSNKISKTIELLRKLHYKLLLSLYNFSIRPYRDHGDIIYDQAYNLSFHQKLESIQCNAVLALAGVLRGSSREKLYQELGLESLQLRRWYRKLRCLYKIYNKQTFGYLNKLIPMRHIKQGMLLMYLP